MILKDIIKSTVDRTQKLIFVNDEQQVLEVSYIDKQDGKHILCVPTQTNCAMACVFCHTTALRGKIPVKNLTYHDIVGVVTHSLSHLGITEDKEHTLLISYMGNGEPLENMEEVLDSMKVIRKRYEQDFKVVRFAVSTLVPRGGFPALARFGDEVRGHGLNVKLHVSLHFTNDAQRHEWMPMAEDIEPTILMLQWYQHFTGNAVELHYTPIAGVNDGEHDTLALLGLLVGRGIPIKFLKFSPLTEGGYRPSERVLDIMEALEEAGIECEYYDPPGRSIGASCGMFLADYYFKYSGLSNIKLEGSENERTTKIIYP